MTEGGFATGDAATRSGEPTRKKTERKPRIAIMGEFSAGKSTLSNLLIGAPALPVKVTATQLPPVWIAFGDAPAHRIDLSGATVPVESSELQRVSVGDTRFVRVFHKSEVLETCDLIDMPGISDPNMPAEVWERVIDHADAVIWCSHSTQAWRQSEAAVWEEFPPEFHDRSLLLLTRFDKITSERDRDRVLRRVEHETDGLFRGVYPISLTQALEAREDFELWKDSGADAFARALMELSAELAALPRNPPKARPEAVPQPQAETAAAPEAPAPATAKVARLAPVEPPPAQDGRIMPRRVTRGVSPVNKTIRPAGA